MLHQTGTSSHSVSNRSPYMAAKNIFRISQKSSQFLTATVNQTQYLERTLNRLLQTGTKYRFFTPSPSFTLAEQKKFFFSKI